MPAMPVNSTWVYGPLAMTRMKKPWSTAPNSPPAPALATNRMK